MAVWLTVLVDLGFVHLDVGYLDFGGFDLGYLEKTLVGALLLEYGNLGEDL